MSYLIDTNVLSELRRKTPDPGVVAWFSQRPPATLHLSVLTLGEIRKELEGVSDEARRQSLLDWLETDLRTFFTGRVLPIDAAVADRWGRLDARFIAVNSGARRCWRILCGLSLAKWRWGKGVIYGRPCFAINQLLPEQSVKGLCTSDTRKKTVTSSRLD